MSGVYHAIFAAYAKQTNIIDSSALKSFLTDVSDSSTFRTQQRSQIWGIASSMVSHNHLAGLDLPYFIQIIQLVTILQRGIVDHSETVSIDLIAKYSWKVPQQMFYPIFVSDSPGGNAVQQFTTTTMSTPLETTVVDEEELFAQFAASPTGASTPHGRQPGRGYAVPQQQQQQQTTVSPMSTTSTAIGAPPIPTKPRSGSVASHIPTPGPSPSHERLQQQQHQPLPPVPARPVKQQQQQPAQLQLTPAQSPSGSHQQQQQEDTLTANILHLQITPTNAQQQQQKIMLMTGTAIDSDEESTGQSMSVPPSPLASSSLSTSPHAGGESSASGSKSGAHIPPLPQKQKRQHFQHPFVSQQQQQQQNQDSSSTTTVPATTDVEPTSAIASAATNSPPPPPPIVSFVSSSSSLSSSTQSSTSQLHQTTASPPPTTSIITRSRSPSQVAQANHLLHQQQQYYILSQQYNPPFQSPVNAYLVSSLQQTLSLSCKNHPHQLFSALQHAITLNHGYDGPYESLNPLYYNDPTIHTHTVNMRSMTNGLTLNHYHAHHFIYPHQLEQYRQLVLRQQLLSSSLLGGDENRGAHQGNAPLLSISQQKQVHSMDINPLLACSSSALQPVSPPTTNLTEFMLHFLHPDIRSAMSYRDKLLILSTINVNEKDSVSKSSASSNTSSTSAGNAGGNDDDDLLDFNDIISAGPGGASGGSQQQQQQQQQHHGNSTTLECFNTTAHTKIEEKYKPPQRGLLRRTTMTNLGQKQPQPLTVISTYRNILNDVNTYGTVRIDVNEALGLKGNKSKPVKPFVEVYVLTKTGIVGQESMFLLQQQQRIQQQLSQLHTYQNTHGLTPQQQLLMQQQQQALLSLQSNSTTPSISNGNSTLSSYTSKPIDKGSNVIFGVSGYCCYATDYDCIVIDVYNHGKQESLLGRVLVPINVLLHVPDTELLTPKQSNYLSPAILTHVNNRREFSSILAAYERRVTKRIKGWFPLHDIYGTPSFLGMIHINIELLDTIPEYAKERTETRSPLFHPLSPQSSLHPLNSLDVSDQHLAIGISHENENGSLSGSLSPISPSATASAKTVPHVLMLEDKSMVSSTNHDDAQNDHDSQHQSSTSRPPTAHDHLSELLAEATGSQQAAPVSRENSALDELIQSVSTSSPPPPPPPLLSEPSSAVEGVNGTGPTEDDDTYDSFNLQSSQSASISAYSAMDGSLSFTPEMNTKRILTASSALSTSVGHPSTHLAPPLVPLHPSSRRPSMTTSSNDNSGETTTAAAAPLGPLHVPFIMPNQPLTMYTCTWNMGNIAPPMARSQLSALLPYGYDIYVISVQEAKYDPRFDWNTPRDDWFGTLQQHLGSLYTCVKYHSLWEIRLCIFVANHLTGRVHSITECEVPTGIANLLGNKGGVITAMCIDHTSICFVAAHLAAHQEKTAVRNENVRDIIKRAKVGNTYTHNNNDYIDIHNQFDHIIWLGDFNYRLRFGTGDRLASVENVRGIIKLLAQGQDGIDKLLTYDQLIQEQENRRVFHGYNEAKISFPPTFKVSRTVGTFYLAQRLPAWCDRVIFKSRNGEFNFLDTLSSNYSLLPLMQASVVPLSTGGVLPSTASSTSTSTTSNPQGHQSHFNTHSSKPTTATAVSTPSASATSASGYTTPHKTRPQSQYHEPSISSTSASSFSTTSTSSTYPTTPLGVFSSSLTTTPRKHHRLACISYGSIPAIHTSDHKPVYSTFLFHPLLLPVVRDYSPPPSRCVIKDLKFRIQFKQFSAQQLVSQTERDEQRQSEKEGKSLNLRGLFKEVKKGLQSNTTNPYLRISSPLLSSTVSTSPHMSSYKLHAVTTNQSTQLQRTPSGHTTNQSSSSSSSTYTSYHHHATPNANISGPIPSSHPIFSTTAIRNTLNPEWPEDRTFYLLSNDPLCIAHALYSIEVLSHNTTTSDTALGYGNIELNEISPVDGQPENSLILGLTKQLQFLEHYVQTVPANEQSLEKFKAMCHARDAIIDVESFVTIPLTYHGLHAGTVTGVVRIYAEY